MANVSSAVQIETGIKHGLSIPFQSVAGEQSIDVGTLLMSLRTKRRQKLAFASLSGKHFFSIVRHRQRVQAGQIPAGANGYRIDVDFVEVDGRHLSPIGGNPND